MLTENEIRLNHLLCIKESMDARLEIALIYSGKIFFCTLRSTENPKKNLMHYLGFDSPYSFLKGTGLLESALSLGLSNFREFNKKQPLSIAFINDEKIDKTSYNAWKYEIVDLAINTVKKQIKKWEF